MDRRYSLNEAKADLAPFESIDLATGIGALQLVPDNAGRLYSLEIAASLISELDLSSNPLRADTAAMD